ncbi:MAG: hypothetical protein NTY77_18730 [Elusimicrobia bacterium]|nr:hypothetical protein [Elusimicrobiota bacterium]
MAHTFLLRPGSWAIHGRFFDARYRLEGVRGELRVRHEPLAWSIEGRLEFADSKQGLELACSVAPSKGGSAASWSWVHPKLGRFDGAFELAGRRMFSSFRSWDGRHAGQVTLTQKGERAYLVEGELRCQGAILGSWELALRRHAALDQ